MGQGDTEGGVDVEGLGLGGDRSSGGGIADMADTHIAGQSQHMASADHIPHQAVVLAQEKPILMAGDDPRGVLTTMLKYRQGIEQHLIDGAVGDDSDDSAHGLSSLGAGAIQGHGPKPTGRAGLNSGKGYRSDPRAGNPAAIRPDPRNKPATGTGATRDPEAAG